jgi:ubiquinol-cytochrome c reductase cytochrome b subunit
MVIVNFFRVIPLIGEKLVLLIFGGFIVGNATTKFFFVIHFLSPFLIVVVAFIHLYFLHRTGSTSSIPLLEGRTKIYFSPRYGVKDSLNLIVLLGLLIGSMLYPFNLGDPEIFREANPLLSPSHIVPEWYFLSRYAILRSIPNKSLGLVALVGRFVSLWRLSLLTSYVTPLKRNKVLSFFFLGTFLLLSTLGRALVEAPFTVLSLYVTVLYFRLTLSFFLLEKIYEMVFR